VDNIHIALDSKEYHVILCDYSLENEDSYDSEVYRYPHPLNKKQLINFADVYLKDDYYYSYDEYLSQDTTIKLIGDKACFVCQFDSTENKIGEYISEIMECADLARKPN
jgi:hypothetical protein